MIPSQLAKSNLAVEGQSLAFTVHALQSTFKCGASPYRAGFGTRAVTPWLILSAIPRLGPHKNGNNGVVSGFPAV